MRVNHYPKHIGDYIRDTIGLSMLEDGAYTRLLDQAYASEIPLPADKRELYRLARAASAAEKKAVDYVVSRYFTLTETGWVQTRVQKELVLYAEKAERSRQNGKSGGRPRKSEVTQKEPTGFPSGSESKTHKNLNQNQEPEPTIPPSAGDESPMGASKPASANAKPIDPVKLIFDKGIALLTGAGMPEQSARAFIGKLRQEHRDVKVLEALVLAETEHPASPVEWLTKTVPAMGSSPKPSSVHIGKQQFGLGFGARK